MDTSRTEQEYTFKPEDYRVRDVMIFGKPVRWDKSLGGILRFEGLPLKTLNWLIEHGHADPKDCQNNAPSLGDIRDFMERNKTKAWITVHGYAVSPKRGDYRVTIEGARIMHATREAFQAFVDMFRTADEFEIDFGSSDFEGSGRCWYD